MDTKEDPHQQDASSGALPKENTDKIKQQPFWKNATLLVAIILGVLSLSILLYPYISKLNKPSNGTTVKAKVSEHVTFENLDILVTSVKAGSSDRQSTVSATINMKDGETMQVTLKEGYMSHFSGYAITVTDASVSEQFAVFSIAQSSRP